MNVHFNFLNLCEKIGPPLHSGFSGIRNTDLQKLGIFKFNRR